MALHAKPGAFPRTKAGGLRIWGWLITASAERSELLMARPTQWAYIYIYGPLVWGWSRLGYIWRMAHGQCRTAGFLIEIECPFVLDRIIKWRGWGGGSGDVR